MTPDLAARLLRPRRMKKIAFVLCLLLGNAFAMEAPVVGGTQVPLGKWPDAVLVVARTALCSGTLIAPDVVLTAGHCIATHPVEVWTGTVDFGASPGERIAVARALAYPDWEHSFDVGVLVLARAASPPPRAVAATCTADAALVRGARVQLVGFGLTTESGTGENTALNETALAVTDPRCTDDAASCQPAIAPGGEFIAGGDGRDACFGDSGGPIYTFTASGAALLGVVSRGLAERTDVPCGGGGVFERADKVASWVRAQTGAHLERTHCTGKADDEDDAAADASGGCSSGGARGGGAPIGLALALGLVSAARRRSARRTGTSGRGCRAPGPG